MLGATDETLSFVLREHKGGCLCIYGKVLSFQEARDSSQAGPLRELPREDLRSSCGYREDGFEEALFEAWNRLLGERIGASKAMFFSLKSPFESLTFLI